MTNSWSNYYNRQIHSDDQLLYTYLLDCIEVKSPSQSIECFRRLFVEGMENTPSQVWRSLERIIFSENAETEFKFILNRSCYILINQWENQPQLKGAIPELIALFETSPATLTNSRTTQRLRELVEHFRQSEQYQALQYRAQLFSPKCEGSEKAVAKPLRTFIHRYPCLYEQCLLTNDSTDEQRQKVRSMRVQKQRQFDLDLSRYITYQQLPKKARAVKNPTLLSDRQLNHAIQQFMGKVDGSNTYRDLAEQFRTSSRWTPCYRTFKKELYEHLSTAIDPKYGNYQFNQKLYKQLQSSLLQHDTQRLNPVLFAKTCRKVLDFLVVESSEQPNHYIFLDLASNLGITATIGLLLKIVLLCRQVKPYLEKRFAILFNHYQAYTKDKVEWLLEALENLNVAFSIHFGAMNLSH